MIRNSVSVAPFLKWEGSSKLACPFCDDAVFTDRESWLSHMSFTHQRELGGSSSEVAKSSSMLVAEYLTLHGVHLSTNPLTVRSGLLSSIRERPLDFVSRLASHVPVRSNRFNLRSLAYDFKLTEIGKIAAGEYQCALQLIRSLLSFLFHELIKVHNNESDFYIQFCLTSPSLSFPISTPYLLPSPDSLNQILAEISLVLTSAENLFLDDGLGLSLTCIGLETSEPSELFGVEPDSHSNLRRSQVASLLEYQYRNRSAVFIAPNVRYRSDCLLVATILGILIDRNPGSWKSNPAIKKPRKCKELFHLVSVLASYFPDIDFNMKQNITFCSRFQRIIFRKFRYRIVIYRSSATKDIYFHGFPSNCHKVLHLLLLGSHICILTNPERFFKEKKCTTCVKVIRSSIFKTSCSNHHSL